MFFKPEFKEKILDGSMCAFISKVREIRKGQFFDIKAVNANKSEFLIQAKCTYIYNCEIKFLHLDEDTERAFPAGTYDLLKECIPTHIALHCKDKQGYFPVKKLGFNTPKELCDCYKKELNRSSSGHLQGYIHFFEIKSNS